MSTTGPIQTKKISANWEAIAGDLNEVPSTFDFSKRTTYDRKEKVMKHYTTKDGNTCFVVSGRRRAMGQTFTLHKQHIG